ncbi:MazG nucleotide pyrophosphohydrolase domain-containing protein [Eubacterium oxidoreducens]|uniref:Tetrapyrrole methylase family protein / MazG family protein n=1 Tax=Eubacterium oxidoreducens TaxID=1732 RepID=A0A1G6BHH7_EUBOX|nr:MazG nucleotide pyrophosphohydrolase domain-containing protein [Eubacterium oxidoreducens]SDB20043.1 tetrapyrrole methylase family protein / MazG family protein [Eubacterium oxidoreducens]
MTEFEKFVQTVEALRDRQHGCLWDKEQTHESLKKCCVEEAAEVVCGINILSHTGNWENLKEELGDLLMQVVMHAQIAKEEGYFDIEDVIKGINDKMIRRHPHVFGDAKTFSKEEWERIKHEEKLGKEWMEDYLPGAFEEAKGLIDVAAKRKQEKRRGDKL